MKFNKCYMDDYCEFSEEHKTLVWKKAPSNRCVIGAAIGSVTKDGYYRTARTLMHRAVWLFFKGEEPNGFIDHINGDRKDNRIDNLRVVTQLHNNWNRTKANGYTYSAKRKKYIAQIKQNYKATCLGYFDTPEEAHSAYLKAKQQRDNQ